MRRRRNRKGRKIKSEIISYEKLRSGRRWRWSRRELNKFVVFLRLLYIWWRGFKRVVGISLFQHATGEIHSNHDFFWRVPEGSEVTYYERTIHVHETIKFCWQDIENFNTDTLLTFISKKFCLLLSYFSIFYEPVQTLFVLSP
jgi:hypothetical protein